MLTWMYDQYFDMIGDCKTMVFNQMKCFLYIRYVFLALIVNMKVWLD
jgi:hypothetical protein